MQKQQEINITDNNSGRLFANTFSFIDAFNTAYEVDELFLLRHKGVVLGEVKIRAVRQFTFGRLSDVVAYLASGRSAHQMAGRLNARINGGKPLAPATPMHHVVLEWTRRDLETTGELLQDYWETIKSSYYEQDETNHQ